MDGTCLEPGLDHPLRRQLHDELHARPSLYFDRDCDIWHVAIVGFDPSLPPPRLSPDTEEAKSDAKHGIADFAGGRLKWEVHTEFLSLTFVADVGALENVPEAFQDLRSRTGGQTVSAVHVRFRNEREGVTPPPTPRSSHRKSAEVTR